MLERIVIDCAHFVRLAFMICACASPEALALTAYDVLGEYWKDPLIGEAVPAQTIIVDK